MDLEPAGQRPGEPTATRDLPARLEGWAARLKPSWSVAVGIVKWLAVVVLVSTLVLTGSLVVVFGPAGLVGLLAGVVLGWALWRIRRPLVALGGVLDNIGSISRAVPDQFATAGARMSELVKRTEGKRWIGPVAMVRFVRASRATWDDLGAVPGLDLDGLKSAADPRMGLALGWTFLGIPLLVAVAAVSVLVALLVLIF